VVTSEPDVYLLRRLVAPGLLSPVHTSNNVEATFDFVAKNGNNVERVLPLLR